MTIPSILFMVPLDDPAAGAWGERKGAMRFLLEKRRAAIAALVALLGAAALFVGAGGAGAAEAYCRTDGTPGDATVDVPGVLFVQNDEDKLGNPAGQGTWVCLVPPNQGGGVGMRDPNPSTPGVVLATATCGDLTGGCTGVENTGVEVDASALAEPNEIGGGDGTGGVVNEPGNCIYVDGASDCVPTGPIVDVTVAEGDLPIVHTEPGCVDVNGTCQVPTVSGANVTVFGDTANETVYVDTLVGGTSDEHGSTCVGVNDPCP
jgi:hypothetical protein